MTERCELCAKCGNAQAAEGYCVNCVKKFQNAVELAAKVRGYFRDRWGKTEWEGMDSIPDYLTGDRDLYDLASKITTRSISPGRKTK